MLRRIRALPLTFPSPASGEEKRRRNIGAPSGLALPSRLPRFAEARLHGDLPLSSLILHRLLYAPITPMLATSLHWPTLASSRR